MSEKKKNQGSSWYLGGMASMTAVCCTHPLDTIKVQLQTQQKVKFGFFGMTANIVRTNGFFALYNGLSAALLRQATYSTTRFAIYEVTKQAIAGESDKGIPLWKMVIMAGVSGAVGGFVGTPADLVNVRMQNDCKLPTELRRNYKNCFDGLIRIVREEGAMRTFSGTTMAMSRGILVTIGQLAFYDYFKKVLIKSGYFKDNLTTHFSSSLLAGFVATVITMPFDVLKTRLMNAKPGQYSGILACAKDILQVGPSGMFKGFIPAFVRLGPHTILTFVFLEQLKKLNL